MNKLMVKVYVWFSCLGAKKKLQAYECVAQRPRDVDIAVFMEGNRIAFLRGSEAATCTMSLVEQLWSPWNEDLLEQLQQRFREGLH